MGYAHEYYIAHKEHIKEQYKEYCFSHREQINTTKRNWFHKHPEIRLSATKKYMEKIKMFCLIHYSGDPPKCISCGIEDIDVLTMDHINGGGTKHRKQFGSHIYNWLKKNNYPEGFQVMCFNCNWKKRIKEMN